MPTDPTTKETPMPDETRQPDPLAAWARAIAGDRVTHDSHSPRGPAMKTKTIVLTIPEVRHLLTLLADAAERGDYYGNRTQYWRRHQRIVDKVAHALEDQR